MSVAPCVVFGHSTVFRFLFSCAVVYVLSGVRRAFPCFLITFTRRKEEEEEEEDNLKSQLKYTGKSIVHQMTGINVS